MPNQDQHAKFKSITKRYGLRLHRVKTHDSLYKKNAVHCASTDKGRFLIKVLSIRNLDQRLTKEQLFSYIKKLKKAHYPNCPKWLTTRRTGKYYVTSHGKRYYVTEWITGRSLQDDVQDYEDLGRALAGLHTLLKHNHTSMSSFTHKQMSNFQRQGHLFHSHLRKINSKSTVSKKWFKKNGHQCAHLAHEAWAMMNTPEVKRILADERNHPALIHGDITIPNVVINSKGLYLVDWDCLRKGSIYYEIAKTLSNTTHYNPVYMQALLRGYVEIRPLNSAERILISAFFRLPREAWIEARRISQGRSQRGLALLALSWDNRLNAIARLDEWAHE
ncbi:Ser/Thr protein kinase RdoA (MazF antagonist) [Paenibacillus sp. DS2015]|uniref:phosphotransferase n=1 Tax=Paenibacillus sp. DS2015 TaxID=3373917 RepID=UPI003D263DE9